MVDIHPVFLARAVRSLAILALPAEGQVHWLKSLWLGEADVVDELAVEFEDACTLSDQFVEAGWLNPTAREYMLSIDALLAKHSGKTTQSFGPPRHCRDPPNGTR